MEGKVAAFVYEDLYKVHAVTVVPTVKGLSSNERNGRGGQGYYERKDRHFSEVLEHEIDAYSEEENVEVHASGYTKDAKSFYFMYSSRTYS